MKLTPLCLTWKTLPFLSSITVNMFVAKHFKFCPLWPSHLSSADYSQVTVMGNLLLILFNITCYCFLFFEDFYFLHCPYFFFFTWRKWTKYKVLNSCFLRFTEPTHLTSSPSLSSCRQSVKEEVRKELSLWGCTISPAASASCNIIHPRLWLGSRQQRWLRISSEWRRGTKRRRRRSGNNVEDCVSTISFPLQLQHRLPSVT